MSVTYTTTPIHGRIFLRPRPHALNSGLLTLVPLGLPNPRKLPPPILPVEVLSRIFKIVFQVPFALIDVQERKARLQLLSLSKSFKNIIYPIFFSYPPLPSFDSFSTFASILKISDKSWDSLRRIPYSTPGRWVQIVDLSHVTCYTPTERLIIDSLLIDLFPLLPFLTELAVSNTIRLSQRNILALARKEGIECLKVLKGLEWTPAYPSYLLPEDPLLSLLQAAKNLEGLDITGPGLQEDDMEIMNIPIHQLNTPPPTPPPSLSLPFLRSLKLLSLPNGPIPDAFIRASMPQLYSLTITPYDDIPSSSTSRILAVHGEKLKHLRFYSPKSWPPLRYKTPSNILFMAPSLETLTLTYPLPSLSLLHAPHPVRLIRLPRPSGRYLSQLEAWLHMGLLPNLKIIQMQEVRWIRPGLSHRAAEAGVQGELKEWKLRLSRLGVHILDMNGMEEPL
ncbi:hypothetical protein Clacol_005670 [Clathrus columnatus]|uniref:F-box domain-containing protein n=1 Tax=Clathrus columnatus TaxID=1419009 RepID=A0AAV5ACM2_9AGAM|nr:hypothetical protein Clacol_005670 [Clathrus columnatus]